MYHYPVELHFLVDPMGTIKNSHVLIYFLTQIKGTFTARKRNETEPSRKTAWGGKKPKNTTKTTKLSARGHRPGEAVPVSSGVGRLGWLKDKTGSGNGKS